MDTIITIWGALGRLGGLGILVICFVAFGAAFLFGRKTKKEDETTLGYWQYFFYETTVSPSEACMVIEEAISGMEGVTARRLIDQKGIGNSCGVFVLRIAQKGLEFRISANSIGGSLLLTWRVRRQPLLAGGVPKALFGDHRNYTADVRQAFFESIQALMGNYVIKFLNNIDKDRKWLRRQQEKMRDLDAVIYRPKGECYQQSANWRWDVRGRQGKATVRQALSLTPAPNPYGTLDSLPT